MVYHPTPLLTFLLHSRLFALTDALLGGTGLLLAALVLGLHREPGNKASNTRLILAVLGVLARTDGLGETNAALEDEQVAQHAESSPLEVGFGAVAVPQVESEPDGLLRDEVGVARQGPQATDDEAALEVLGGELRLVLAGDAGGLLVLVFGAVEGPLLLVGEVLDDEEEEGDAREDQVGQLERLHVREAREQEEVVGRRRDEEQEQALRQGDEDHVEQEEDEPVVDLGAHHLPAVVLGADLVAALAPVVERQADLCRRQFG